jgi:hypothetical protein
LLSTWALVAAVCAAGCAVARLVGRRLDDAEARRSRRQWQLMCEALDAEDLAGVTTASASGRTTDEGPATSPREPSSASALAAFGVHRASQ